MIEAGYLSVGEAAKKWGKTPRNVRIHCQKGHIPDVKCVGGRWLVPETAVDPGLFRGNRKRKRPVLAILQDECRARLKGGLYHRLQVDMTFNSNHMEGSALTYDQTKWIFETATLGALSEATPVDDIIEARNHFRCVDFVILSARSALTERFVKRLHALLKSGTSDADKSWFAVGDYKKLDNIVGETETCPAADVPERMRGLLRSYAAEEKTLETLLDFHVRFERIHPFQDGNGRVGRLILLKECLKHRVAPFIIPESLRRFYYLGLAEWPQGRRARLLDVCRTAQDVFAAGLARYAPSFPLPRNMVK